MRPAEFRDRARLDVLLRRAERVQDVLTTVPGGAEGAILEGVVAIGGTAVVYRGSTTSGRRVAVKVPVEFISHWNELEREDLGEGLAEAGGRLKEEASWLDRLGGAGLFPRKLFPPPGGEVWFVAGSSQLPLLVLEWGEGLPLRHALGVAASSRHLIRLQSAAQRAAYSLVVARWMEGVFEGLQRILHEHGGVYTDVAPDNFLVQAEGGPVVFLDAGAILPVGSGEPVQTRPNYLPAGFQGRLSSLVAGGGLELEGALAGMVAKLFATGLAGELPSASVDPSREWVQALLSLETCFFDVIDGCLASEEKGGFEAVLDRLGGCIRSLESSAGGSGRLSVWRRVGGIEI